MEKPNVRFHDGQILSEEPLNKAMEAVDYAVEEANKVPEAVNAASSAAESASAAAASAAAIKANLEAIKGSGDIPAATVAQVVENTANISQLALNDSIVEGQINAIEGNFDRIFNVGENLLNDAGKEYGYYFNNNGDKVRNDNYVLNNEFIKYDKNLLYNLSGWRDNGNFYDDVKPLYIPCYNKYKEFIGLVSVTSNMYSSTFPEETSYIKISYLKSFDSFKLMLYSAGDVDGIKAKRINGAYREYEEIIGMPSLDTLRINALEKKVDKDLHNIWFNNLVFAEKSKENLFSSFWENGNIDSEGNEVDSDVFIRSGFIELEQNTNYTLTTNAVSGTYVYIKWYDDEKNLTSTDSRGSLSTISITTTDRTKYIRVCLWNNPAPAFPENSVLIKVGNSITSDLPYTISEKYIKPEDSTLLSKLPQKYFREEADETVSSIIEKTDSPCLILTIVTDSHYDPTDTFGEVRNTQETYTNIKYVQNKVPSHAIINLGDMETSNEGAVTSKIDSDKAINVVRSYMCQANNHVFMVNGNHDGVDGTTRTDNYCSIATHNQEYAKRDNGSAWFYYDFDFVKIRCIFLQTNSTSLGIGQRGWSNEQISWLDRTLVSTPNDYNIMLFEHIGLWENLTNKSIFQTLTNNYNSHSGKFADKTGKILAMFVGHEHGDGVIYEDTTGLNYPTIITNCSWYVPWYKEVIPTPSTANIPPRSLRHYTQDAWDTMIYRPDENKIYMIRFGAGEDTTVCGIEGKNGDREIIL